MKKETRNPSSNFNGVKDGTNLRGILNNCGPKTIILPPKIRNSNLTFAVKAGLNPPAGSDQPGETSHPRLPVTKFGARRGSCDWTEQRLEAGSMKIQPIGEGNSSRRGSLTSQPGVSAIHYQH